MRRSEAPSVLHKSKRVCSKNYDIVEFKVESHDSNSRDEEYKWGSGSHRNDILPQNRYENKRIFNVVWRDVSTKKHKTWKGDGTLEVNQISIKAFLKDETGKCMGCSTKFNINDLHSDFQMIIGGKEIEIQNEIMDQDELRELQKKQFQNPTLGKEEQVSSKDFAEETKKSKGDFDLKSVLLLNSPKVPFNVEKCFKNYQFIKPNSDTYKIQKPSSSNLMNSKCNIELICFIKPSELQQFLCKKVLNYCFLNKNNLNKLQSMDIKSVLQHICNHPSFINQKTTSNDLICQLIPFLPDWSEMGPSDSGKLEFLQFFLTDLSKTNSQSCTILAKHSHVLNMIQGLCDFMNIKCLRLSSKLLKDVSEQEFCLSKNKLTQVIIIDDAQMLTNYNIFTFCKKLIIFEEFSINGSVYKTENVKDVTIFNFVTAFTIEELLLFDNFNSENIENLMDELANITNMEMDCCYMHSKTKCNCFKTTGSTEEIGNNTNVSNWEHFKKPFDAQLLKNFSLEHIADNVVTIFCRKLN